MKTKLSGIRPSPCQLYIQWIRKDWSKTSLSSVVLLPDFTWRPLFTRCCKDLNCVQTSVASLRIISGLLSWNIPPLPPSTLHRNPLSSPYLYSPHGISEKKIKASCKTYPSFPMAEIQSLHYSALLTLAGSSHTLASAIPGGLCIYTRWCYLCQFWRWGILCLEQEKSLNLEPCRYKVSFFFLLIFRRIVIKEGNGRKLETRE